MRRDMPPSIRASNISHFPGAPKLDFRAEAVSTDPRLRIATEAITFTTRRLQGRYTNKGYMFGNWIGREGKGGQAWLTYWLSPQERIQLSYRNVQIGERLCSRRHDTKPVRGQRHRAREERR